MNLLAGTEKAADSLAVRRLRIVLARIGVTANTDSLLEMPRYLDPAAQAAEPVVWSLLSALPAVEDLPAGAEVDAWLHILDTPAVPPAALVTPERALLIGDFSAWEGRVANRRYTLFGNAGFLSKYTYATLEYRYDTLSFHAVSMYDERRDELYVVIGGPGAGKTVTMLEGTLRRGLRVFATEMTHLRLAEEGLVFYKGSLYDNVRLQNLEDFPEARSRLAIPAPKGGDKDPKVCLSFEPIATDRERLVNPRVSLLFPRIEGERTTTIAEEIADRETLVRMLYENASEMILRPRLYYEQLAVGGLEFPGASAWRLALCRRLVDEARITQARSILAGPRDSLAGVR